MSGEGVAGNEDFFEGIADGKEGAFLLFAFFAGGNGKSGLDVEARIAEVGHKINFHFLLLARSLALVLVHFHGSDIHAVAPDEQLVVNHVFHDVRLLRLAEIDARIAQPHVHKIILVGGIDVTVSSDIETFGTLDEECLLQETEKLLDRGR